MGVDTQTIAWAAIGIGFIGVAWAIFWPMAPHPGLQPISTHWDIVYVDDDGNMTFTLVRVLKINPTSRRMTAWCSTSGCEKVFKLSKIVKATDVRSGAHIDIARLIDKPLAMAERDSTAAGVDAPVMPGDRPHSDGSSWWSASRLGLH